MFAEWKFCCSVVVAEQPLHLGGYSHARYISGESPCIQCLYSLILPDHQEFNPTSLSSSRSPAAPGTLVVQLMTTAWRNTSGLPRHSIPHAARRASGPISCFPSTLTQELTNSSLRQQQHFIPRAASLHQRQRRCYSNKKKFNFQSNPETSFLERVGLRRREYQQERSNQPQPTASMASNFYLEGTPDEVKSAKGLHLITMNTPNGQGTTTANPHSENSLT